MANKNLPIKIFKKRDNIDDRRTEGMSGNELPKWALTPAQLRKKSDSYLKVMASVEQTLQDRVAKKNFLPAVLRVKLRDVAVAKSHRSEVGKVFNVNRKYNFLGMSDEFDLMIKVDSPKDLNNIKQNISNIQEYAYGLSAIEELALFRPVVEAEGDVLKIRLINYHDYSLNMVVDSLFRKKLDSLGLVYKKTRYAEDLTIYKINAVSDTKLDDLRDFEAMYSITPMPKADIGMDSAAEDYNVPIKYPDSNIEYPIVGVLDSGIADIDQLKPWLLEDSYSAYPESLLDRGHGTFVAGVIVYGDELEGRTWTGLEGSMLYSAAVFPNPKLETVDEDELIENIRAAIESRPDIKIWNLSGGMKVECDLSDFSDFGKFLDDIQKTKDIMIVKSAGNCANFMVPDAVQRIPKSADSVRSLVVGSIAHKKSLDDLAELHWPSPFSRIGFGPNHLIKPDLTHYGGNSGKNGFGEMTFSGVRSFSVGGTTVSNVGTSFSTPRITGLAAALDFKIAEDFNPLLLKALMIHSAKYPSAVTLSAVDKLKYMGYGLPLNANDIVYNSPNEITLILQDTLIKSNYYEILDFPYPTDMIDNGKYYGEITLTLVSSPIVDNNHSTEYCQSNIDVSFGTYEKIKARDIEKSYILNEFGTDGAMNLLRDALYSKKHLNNPLHDFAGERMLRNYGKKYHPIKKYAIDLTELTETNAINGLSAPKKWFLRLEGLYSSFCENRAVLDGIELSQEFCMVITIRDKRKKKNVYDNVTRQLNSNNFIHQNIQLRNEINLRLESSEDDSM
jgi:subtilisin family serine protease